MSASSASACVSSFDGLRSPWAGQERGPGLHGKIHRALTWGKLRARSGTVTQGPSLQLFAMDENNFNFLRFVSGLKGLSSEDRRVHLQQELDRARGILIRESQSQFQQQLYIRRLQRLLHFFEGQSAHSDLTPMEKQAYGLLAGEKALAKS